MSRCPYGRHCAIATRASGARVSSRSRNSSRSRDLPVPAGAMTLTRNGRRSSSTRLAASSSCARSPVRPKSGIRTRARVAARPASGSARSGARFPFATSSTAGPNAKWPAAALAVREPHMIDHGSASCCNRAAVFTASPVTRKSPELPSRVATTSPVFRPMRIGSRSPSFGSARTRSRSCSAAAIARTASSPCAWGKPKTAMTASPMNFSSVPPCSATTSFAIA